MTQKKGTKWPTFFRGKKKKLHNRLIKMLEFAKSLFKYTRIRIFVQPQQ